MAPELHLRPDRLRTHAATAATLADELYAAGAGPASARPDVDRQRALRRVADELAELGVALAAAAAAAEQGDGTAARSFGDPRRPS